LDDAGHALQPTPESLINMAKVDASALDERILNCDVVILCDVDNMLLGPLGAANVFGPQKGASDNGVLFLEDFLDNFSKVSATQTGKNMASIKHGGAAGGATAGLHTWLNAKLVNGIGYFLALTNFEAALQRADLVITGEGSIDRQTLQGKGPYGVALQAKQKGIPVIGIAGRVPLEHDDELADYFDALFSINNEACDLGVAMANTKANLERTALAVGNLISLQKEGNHRVR